MSKIKCNHKEYIVKQIMGFKFCICNLCGFQWKGGNSYEDILLDEPKPACLGGSLDDDFYCKVCDNSYYNCLCCHCD
uniref:Uncharacterized protein n=1 Tax=viral metagenome TaxID=1070528 RepID=A0A6M3L2Y1_9ZZZZ